MPRLTVSHSHTVAFFLLIPCTLVVVYQHSERAYCSIFTYIPKMEATSPAEKFVVTCQTARYHNAEDYNRCIRCREEVKPRIVQQTCRVVR